MLHRKVYYDMFKGKNDGNKLPAYDMFTFIIL